MTKRRLRIVENAVLMTFPIALFAGCAGSDIKPSPVEKSELTYVETYTSYENPLPEDELTDISMVYTVEQNMSDTSPVETPQSTEPDNMELTADISDDGVTLSEQLPMETMDGFNENKANSSEMINASSSTSQLPALNTIHFDTDKSELPVEQRQQLQQHADYLNAHPGTTMVINGHADIRGTQRYNQSLSEQRALAVYELLVELGVPEHQLMKRGFGETQPMHDEHNWAENRRVELEFQDPMMLTGM